MANTPSERRMAENEVVFREYNENIQKGFDDIKRIAEEDGQSSHQFQLDAKPLKFYCECSDENCKKRILLKPSRYNDIHEHRDRFIILSGHEAESIERIIGKEADFFIVEKFMNPPESANGLNVTSLDNT
jgi:hypothetical protein